MNKMSIERSKIISDKSGEIEVLNVKLDDTLSDKEIMDLIDISYNISNTKGK